VAAIGGCGLFPELESYGDCAEGKCADASAGTGGTSNGGSGNTGNGGAGNGGTSGGGTGNGGTSGASGGNAGAGGSGGGEPCGAHLGGPMVAIPNEGYCIDATEVKRAEYQEYLDDVGSTPPPQETRCAWNTSTLPPSYLMTVDATKPEDPIRGTNFCQAVSYCAWAGKRLCGKIGGGALESTSAGNTNVDQFYVACSHDGIQKFPYGNDYVSGVCNDSKGNVGPNGQAGAGSLSTCEGGYPGIFDMSGNVQEWVDHCRPGDAGTEECILKGGSWNFPGGAQSAVHCSFGQWTAMDGNAPQNGFRCCKDL
jgi:formylglycine-generating enzyme required for sulfatase activity